MKNGERKKRVKQSQRRKCTWPLRYDNPLFSTQRAQRAPRFAEKISSPRHSAIFATSALKQDVSNANNRIQTCAATGRKDQGEGGRPGSRSAEDDAGPD